MPIYKVETNSFQFDFCLVYKKHSSANPSGVIIERESQFLNYNQSVRFPKIFMDDIEEIKKKIQSDLLTSINSNFKLSTINCLSQGNINRLQLQFYEQSEDEILVFINNFVQNQVKEWFYYAQDILNGDALPVRQFKVPL